MQARVVEIDPEEGGVLVLQSDGTTLTAMNCLGYGCRGDMPTVGQDVAVEFSCQYDEEDLDWNSFFDGNRGCELKLERTGLWSYDVWGRLVAVESSANEDAIVDCGVCLLPAPITVSDERCVGAFVFFKVSRLDAWCEVKD